MDPWIKVRTNLRDNPKVKWIAKKMKCHHNSIIGGLVTLWSIADQQSRDGVLIGYSEEDIDAEFGKPGFAAALAAEEIGWLVIGKDRVTVPLGDHNGESAKKRSDTARRVQEHRARKAVECNDDVTGDRYRECIPRPLRRHILARDGRKCVYCGLENPGTSKNQSAGSRLSIDHVVPVTMGGETAAGNLVTACGDCNRGKNNRTPEEAGMELLHLTPAATAELNGCNAAAFQKRYQMKMKRKSLKNAARSSGSGSLRDPHPPAPSRAGADVVESPVVWSTQCVGPVPAWSLTQAKLEQYAASYPQTDVHEALLAARQHTIDKERRTAKGMPAFLSNWLNRAVRMGEHRKGGPRAASHPPRSNGNAVKPRFDDGFVGTDTRPIPILNRTGTKPDVAAGPADLRIAQ